MGFMSEILCNGVIVIPCARLDLLMVSLRVCLFGIKFVN
jgi:hypothetical protein